MKRRIKIYAEVVGKTIVGKNLTTVVELWVPEGQQFLEPRELDYAANYWRQKYPGIKLAEPVEVRPLPASNAV